ncbi:MAG: SGNH/GDSL hydrolase family protein [Gemmatimonadales bacterium]
MTANRRTFIRDASAFAAAGIGCLTLGGRDLFGLAGRLRTPGREVIGAAARPFNMLAFGDSIMWGQGLTEEQKFATLVKNWVNTNLPGRGVTFQNFAHSGAVIMPDLALDAAGVYASEVPADYPSIHAQLYRALATLVTRGIPPSEIDLVLLNGGINDIGVTSILSPWASSGSISELTRDSITSGMNYLLPIAAGAFPNAKFVVPGYFPIITDDSSTGEITALLGILFGPLGLAITPGVKGQLIANCSAFYAESDVGLRNAVTAQNGRTPNRCVYADPGFSAYNGYGASQRCLFNVGESDPMVSLRKAYCETAGQGANPKCLSASMGHPNVNGAIKYANAMSGKLGVFLAEWQGLRRLFACVDPKPVMGSAATYTVWVEDYETRLPVAATVTVGTQTVSSNTSFSHTFGCEAPATETLEGPRGKPGRTITVRGACEAIGITAPGYISQSIATRA